MNRKHIMVFVTAFLLSGLINLIHAKEPERINKRDGLNNFYHKLSLNDTIKVAYFGGSITAAPGWRVKSFAWLQNKYPNCHFVEINATLGGTGSDLGAFRLQKAVLDKMPDLVFVEFAVNDNSTPKKNIQKQYEGIVRKIWKNDPTTDIFFVYTLMEKMMADYSDGGISESVAAAEIIADYYSIPSLNFAYEVLERIENNTLLIRGDKNKIKDIPLFSKDGVHPSVETGHVIYFEELLKSFEKLSAQRKVKRLKSHKIAKPLFNDNWETASLLDNSKLTFSGDWEKNPQRNSLFVTKSFNAIVSFEFEGTMFGISDIIGPKGCKLEIKIDDVKQSVLRFDKYCNYDRSHYVFIPGLKRGKHRVEIRMKSALTKEEKITILKEKTPERDNFPEHLSENIFRLKRIMTM